MSKAFSGAYYTGLPYIDEINVKRKFHPLYSGITAGEKGRRKHNILMSNAQNAGGLYRFVHIFS